MQKQSARPLFEKYPGIREHIPHCALGTLPTPVQRLDRLESLLGVSAPHLYVKRDDLSGMLYGGNKVRKLEFILGRVLQDGYREVLTFGGTGSNHVVATGLYARAQGVSTISLMIPQPNSHVLRRNLLVGLSIGIEYHLGWGMVSTAGLTAIQLIRHRFLAGRFPYLIAPGGSSPLGLLGFVNAGLELGEQVLAGLLPEPDFVYAASGSMGTVTGLLLGLKAAGLKTKVVAVRVTARQYSSVGKARRLFRAANALLHQADNLFPVISFPTDDFLFEHRFYGSEYGRYTPEGVRAIRIFRDSLGIELEGSYTGKTLAALLADGESGKLRGKTVVFWNTHNSSGFGQDLPRTDYRALPRGFHPYFETDVQPLDR
jgi:D-cysteine desulfhydrase